MGDSMAVRECSSNWTSQSIPFEGIDRIDTRQTAANVSLCKMPPDQLGPSGGAHAEKQEKDYLQSGSFSGKQIHEQSLLKSFNKCERYRFFTRFVRMQH